MENESEFDFNNAVVENVQYLRNYAKRFGLQEVDQEELVSNTILKAFENQNKYKIIEGHDFGGWLTRILTNLFINDYRRSISRPTDLYDNEGITILREQKSYSEEADSSSIYDELLKSVKGILSDENYRIFMAYVNGYQYNQIAEIFELPMGTVKSRIFFSRQQIIEYVKNGNKIQKRKHSQIQRP